MGLVATMPSAKEVVETSFTINVCKGQFSSLRIDTIISTYIFFFSQTSKTTGYMYLI